MLSIIQKCKPIRRSVIFIIITYLHDFFNIIIKTWNILNKHNHNGMNTKPIYTKVNSIKRKDNKIELVLNKLYYNPLLSNNITSDPLGINVIYDSKDYMHTTEDGEDIDMTKLEANYENNFDELKNTGTRYKYIFSDNLTEFKV